MEDKELFARIRGGDRDAFDSLFRTYYAQLVGFAERVVHDRAAAEDVAQDVMLELWRRRETLAINEWPRAYLFQSARNRALNRLRHAAVQKRGEPTVAAELTTPVQ